MSPASKKLLIELVPTTCFFSNVRTTIKPSQWNKIRRISYESAGHICEICGDTGKNQGYKHDLECHEIWEYDDENHIQKLIGLISLCPICHSVKHLGRAIAMGKQTICFKQLAKINKWTIKQIKEHVTASFELHTERSKHEWKLDLSLLNEEPYCLKINVDKKRIFEVKKYKKKRKKKTVKKKPTNKRPAKK